MKHGATHLILNAIILLYPPLKINSDAQAKHVFQPETYGNVSIPPTSVLILSSTRDGTIFPSLVI